MLTSETITHIQSIDLIAWRCIKVFHFFKLTSKPGGKFWNITQNALGDNFCLLWCHLFGKRTDDLHFSQLFSRPDIIASGSSFSSNSVKQRLLSCIQLTDSEYEIFWKKVNSARDHYIAHRDMGNPNPIFPDISICKAMAEELRNILSELVTINLQIKPQHQELDLLHRYQIGYPNAGLEKECLEEFETGIQLIEII